MNGNVKHCRRGHAYRGYRCPTCHPRRNGSNASRARSPRTFRADSVLSSLGSGPQTMTVMHYCQHCDTWYQDGEQHECAAAEAGATAEWLTPAQVARLDNAEMMRIASDAMRNQQPIEY